MIYSIHLRMSVFAERDKIKVFDREEICKQSDIERILEKYVKDLKESLENNLKQDPDYKGDDDYDEED